MSSQVFYQNDLIAHSHPLIHCQWWILRIGDCKCERLTNDFLPEQEFSLLKPLILLNSFHFQMECVNSPFGLMNLFFIYFPIYSSSLVLAVQSHARLGHHHGIPVLSTYYSCKDSSCGRHPVTLFVEDMPSCFVLFDIFLWMYWIHLRFWYEKCS